MGAYFALQIEESRLNYNAVVSRFPKFKEDIDLILTADGYVVNEDGTVSKQITA